MRGGLSLGVSQHYVFAHDEEKFWIFLLSGRNGILRHAFTRVFRPVGRTVDYCLSGTINCFSPVTQRQFDGIL